MRLTAERATIGLALLMAALLAFVSLRDSALAQSAVLFGIRPADAGADAPASGAYFTYTLEPGASLTDEAVVVNSGEDSVVLKLYAADGVTAIGGGTAFAAADEEHNGVRSWLSTDVSQVELGTKESAVVPFTLRVPADAAPGDHVAGWVVEGPPKAGSSQGLAAAVVERVGVAVVVRVPGPAREEVVLSQMCLNQESGSNYLQAAVANEGNVLTRGSGTLVLATGDGTQVFERSVELGTVLPGDDTFLRVDASVDPGPGSYVANLTLHQPNGRRVSAESEIKIGEEKANGCLAVGGAEEQPPIDLNGPLSVPGDDIPWLVITLISTIVGLIALLAVREFVWRRRRG